MQNPYSAVLDMQRQAWEQAADAVSSLGDAPDARRTMDEIEVGQTPSEVVYEENKLRLLHYESRTEEQHDVPILVVYALINRPYILDLQPDRSVVRTLLDNGFDVYLIDWGEPSTLDRELGLADYVDRYIDNCVDVVRERSGREQIDILGYCMGGTMSVMYSALHREKVRNLALMAAGLCFENTGGVLEKWGQQEYYDPEDVVDTYGNVPAEFLDLGFALMDPVANYMTKYVRFYENMDDEDFVENFARMEEWLGDGIDVAGRAYVEFLRDVYQENALYENELELNGKHVDLNELDMPILQIVAEYDHLIPPSASKPFNEVVPSEDTEIIEAPTGHIGMSVSSRSHEDLWPEVCEWFEAHDDEDDAEESEASSEDESAPEAHEATSEDEASAPEDTGAVDAQEPTPELESISGIGPAYAADLDAAGVSTVEDLADADAAALADDTGITASRLEDWIEQANQQIAE